MTNAKIKDNYKEPEHDSHSINGKKYFTVGATLIFCE